MSNPNTGWLFYKKMYSFLNNNTRPDPSGENDEYNPYNISLNETGTEVLDTKFYEYKYYKGQSSFVLKTIYPGLVIGLGYAHNAKNSPDNFDFGFFFDHTTGMPLISGSSVKGVIRSMFKRLENEFEQEGVIAFFKDIFMKYQIDGILANEKDTNIKILQEIENIIFTGQGCVTQYDRDKFFDAYILSGDDKDLILADDFITPHPDPFSDPIPNRMLKVRAGVSFEFSFDLYDSKLSNDTVLTADNKKTILLEIIQFTGMGAKTNTGYGQFEENLEFLPEQNKDNNSNITENLPFSFDTFMEDIKQAKNAKSIKSKFNQMKKKHELCDDEKKVLLELIEDRVVDECILSDDWKLLPSKKRRNEIGDYEDVFKHIN